MNDTLSGTRTRRARGRRCTLVAAALALTAVVGTAACTQPTKPPPRPTTTTTTGAPGCTPIDFDRASVQPPAAPGEPWALSVSGTRPPGTDVRLEPVTYVRQPEYWVINVLACRPARLPGANAPGYAMTEEFFGNLGTRGIEVVGAHRSQRINVVAGKPPVKPPVTPGTIMGDWLVTGLTGGITGGIVPLDESLRIPLTVGADGWITGRLCNTYRATWKAQGASLTIGKISSTTLPCPGPALGQVLNRYYDALGRVASYRIDGDRLTLVDGDGRDVVEATRVLA